MNAMTETKPNVNKEVLEQKVKNMYREVALHPEVTYHFEMGRALAERLGYPTHILDHVPAPAIDSFAGVGYYFDLAQLQEGENVVDLGSGSGMDVFFAARQVGEQGEVIGIDMTIEQLAKAEKLKEQYNFKQVVFRKSYIESIPVVSGSMDAVISNGVINLCPDKEKVFAEVARVLKPKGRMAIADIVTEKQLPENVVCDSTLWASCIGGAGQEDTYKNSIEKAGLQVLYVRNNSAYEFISKSARGASKQYGVKSVSLLAQKK